MGQSKFRGPVGGPRREVTMEVRARNLATIAYIDAFVDEITAILEKWSKLRD